MRFVFACCAACALLFVPSPARAGDPPASFTLGGSVNVVGFAVEDAYFGSADQPGDDADYAWAESILRLKAGWRIADGLSFDVAAVGSATLGADYYGLADAQDVAFDVAQLKVGAREGDGVLLTVGRQDVEIGDGFLVGDGYFDRDAALWSLPLTFWDGARLDVRRAGFTATALVLRTGPWRGTGEDRGTLSGLDLSWAAGEEGPSVGLGHFRRHERGALGNEANVTSLRAGHAAGPLALGGEYAIERGQYAGRELRASGWHADVALASSSPRKPYVQLMLAAYSGDRPDTERDEAFFTWNVRWHDWNRYYHGDIVSSTLLENTDQRIVSLEAGIAPTEATRLRVIAQRHRAATGTALGLPEGTGRHLADEVDAVLDITAGDHWSFWIVAGWARPGEAGRAIFGHRATTELIVSTTFAF